MSVPVATHLAADLERRRPQRVRRPGARRPRPRPPDVDVGARPALAGRGPAARRTARSRFGSKATTSASHLAAVAALRGPCRDSPATTCALVTTSRRPTTKPLPSWMRRQATPWTFTVDGTTAIDDLLGEADGRRAAGRGRGPARARRTTRGNWPSPTNRRSVSSVSGGSGQAVVHDLGDRRGAGLRRRTSPRTSAMIGRSSHRARTTPTTPAAAPGDAVGLAERRRRAGRRGAAAGRRPGRWPGR